jgi:hypothetical protein
MSTRKESAKPIMVSEGVEFLHVVQNSNDRVVVYRHLSKEEDWYTFELQNFQCCDWNTRIAIAEEELDQVFKLFRRARGLLILNRDDDE